MISTKHTKHTKRTKPRKARNVHGFRVFRVFVCFVGLTTLFSASAAAQDQPPRFRSTVEVTSLDVSVVDDHGSPITFLTPADFLVRIDGNPRKVITAEWVPLTEPAADAPVVNMPDGFSTNENSTAGRLIVLAVDEPNIRFGGAIAIARAANAFIDRLLPSDRIAVAGFGPGAPATVFTADRQRVKQAISRMVGQKQAGVGNMFDFSISLTEALAIDRGDGMTLSEVIGRECSAIGGRPDRMCPEAIETQARTMAMDANREGDATVNGLRALFRGLRNIEGPKTLVLISEGFVMTDQNLVIELGGLAAAARTSLYVLRLDNQAFMDVSAAHVPVNAMGDRLLMTQGLEGIAGA